MRSLTAIGKQISPILNKKDASLGLQRRSDCINVVTCCFHRTLVPPGREAVWRWLQGPAGVEAVPPHVLLGADVVLHLQAGLENGLLLRRPAEPGEPLVKGTESTRRRGCDTSASKRRPRKWANWVFWLSFSGHVCLYESCVPQHVARQWGQAFWGGRGGALQVRKYWYFSHFSSNACPSACGILTTVSTTKHLWHKCQCVYIYL